MTVDMNADTFTERALAAYAENEAATERTRLERLARRAEMAADRLQAWTGLAVAAPATAPFKWQGYWFNADMDGDRFADLLMYCWDAEDGWGWWVCRGLAGIGRRIADLNAMDDDARRAKADEPEYLPDFAIDNVNAVKVA